MKEEPEKKPSIMSKPLPVILEEIELVAADARKAADDAKSAGEKASEEVMRKPRKLFLKMSKDITEELAEGKK